MNKCYLFLLFFLIASSCANPQKLKSDKSIDKVYFGKTGGFTNIPMEYVLFENGSLFKIQHDSLLRIRKLNGKQVRSLENQRKEIDFKQLILNEPGNITYSIKVVTAEFEKEIKWNDATDNNKIKEFYKSLVTTVKE